MDGEVLECLIRCNIFLSKTLNKVFQIIRDFVFKQGEQIHRGAFSCDIVIDSTFKLKGVLLSQQYLS